MAGKSGKKRKRRSYVQEPVKIPADVLLPDAIVRVVAQKGVEGTSTREQRLRFLWHIIWAWLSQHKAACTFMIRYYYSASFDENTKNSYREIWQRIADRLHELLPNTDTESLVYMALETTASAIYPVCAGWRPDGAGVSEYGFRRLNGLVNEFLSN